MQFSLQNVFGETRELDREETKAGSWIRLDRKVINTAKWRKYIKNIDIHITTRREGRENTWERQIFTRVVAWLICS